MKLINAALAMFLTGIFLDVFLLPRVVLAAFQTGNTANIYAVSIMVGVLILASAVMFGAWLVSHILKGTR